MQKPMKLIRNPTIAMIARSIARDREIYLFVLPVVVFYAVFSFSPFFFIQIAFRDYRITRSMAASPWVGLRNFESLFRTVGFLEAFRNTLIISLYQIVFAFPVPLVLAILLNEIPNLGYKRVIQTIIYLPHFISWAIISGILYSLLTINGGLINNLLQFLGQKEPVAFLTKPEYFRGILVISSIWKESGWGTIIYLAAITKIDPEQYEAAVIDGANRFQRILHITIPGIRDVIVILLILRVGNLMNVGFEQVLVLLNPMVLEVGDVLDVFVYRVGLVNSRYSFAAAAGICKSVIGAILIYLSDFIAKRLGERGLF